jgi:hypothetical protein
VCVTVNQTVTVTREPEAPPVPPMTLREMQDAYLRWNARKRHPHPLCRLCGMPFAPDDADPFDKHVCCTCGVNRLEKAARRLFRAKGKKARKKALKRLMSIPK